MPENRGVGGGYFAGLDYAAVQKKYDWVWLFDQDSVPDANGLEQLLSGLSKFQDRANDVGILAPVIANREMNRRYPAHAWRDGLCEVDTEIEGDEVLLVDTVFSSGSLIRREAVEKAGLPRADFFMDFVDHEHCLRIRGAGYRVMVIGGSRLEHTLGAPRRIDFLGREKTWAYHPPWRRYYMVRNEIFTVWHCYPNWRTKYSTIRRLLHGAVYTFLFGQEKFASLRMLYRGFRDGVRGNLGIRFLPEGRIGSEVIKGRPADPDSSEAPGIAPPRTSA